MRVKNQQNAWTCKYHNKYMSVELNASYWFLIHAIRSILYLPQLLCLVYMHENPSRHTNAYWQHRQRHSVCRHTCTYITEAVI